MRAWVYFRPGLDQLFYPLPRSHMRIIPLDIDLARLRMAMFGVLDSGRPANLSC
jgi:hypothetical protein